MTAAAARPHAAHPSPVARRRIIPPDLTLAVKWFILQPSVAKRPEQLQTRLTVYEAPDDAKKRAWIETVRVSQLGERQVVAVLSRHGLTLPQFDVVATLRFSEGVTQQELAERLLVTKGNVCGVLDRLEGLGWVERRPDPEDRRANRLHLTNAGRRKLDA